LKVAILSRQNDGRELSSSLGAIAIRKADYRLGFAAALAKNPPV
jgi:hypothetical protein